VLCPVEQMPQCSLQAGSRLSAKVPPFDGIVALANDWQDFARGLQTVELAQFTPSIYDRLWRDA
jgi:hypothetical protein